MQGSQYLVGSMVVVRELSIMGLGNPLQVGPGSVLGACRAVRMWYVAWWWGGGAHPG